MNTMPIIWTMNRVEHTLSPIFDENSTTLILGSMPSIKSREIKKYYGHKENRFWKVLENIYGEKIIDWQSFVLRHHLALWDVIATCDIEASSDASIRNVTVNDIAWICANSKIERIFLLGKSAYNLYYKYIYADVHIEGRYLPSPSSANAQYSFERLCEIYSVIKNEK